MNQYHLQPGGPAATKHLIRLSLCQINPNSVVGEKGRESASHIRIKNHQDPNFPPDFFLPEFRQVRVHLFRGPIHFISQ